MIADSQIANFRWDDARVLLALLREKTLLRAAKRLSIDASTVSRRLDALEEALGARLFDRTPEGARPTAMAEELFPIAEQMEQAAIGIARAVEKREVEPEGEVRITAPPGVADHMLAGALLHLYERHPKIAVRLDARIAYVDLTRREADLALRAVRPTSGDLVSVKLGVAPEILLTSEAYARALGRLEKTGDARWITWEDDLAQMPAARWVSEHVPSSAVVLRTSSIGSQIAAARAGVGVCWMSEPFERLGGLVEVPFSRGLAKKLPTFSGGSLYLVGHRALRDVPRIAAVWDWIVEEARSIGLSGT
jgi:DNA-binding transcriptional LysR family regulator